MYCLSFKIELIDTLRYTKYGVIIQQVIYFKLDIFLSANIKNFGRQEASLIRKKVELERKIENPIQIYMAKHCHEIDQQAGKENFVLLIGYPL